MNSKSSRFFLYLLMAMMVVTQVAFTGTGDDHTSSESVVKNTDNADTTDSTNNTNNTDNAENAGTKENTGNAENTGMNENTGNTGNTGETEDQGTQQPAGTTTIEVKKNAVAAGENSEVTQAVMIRLEDQAPVDGATSVESEGYDALADHYLGLAETKEESEYQDMIVCYVDPYLPVRSEASRESKTLGKLYPGSYADVVERGETWSKVKSGNLEGWVQNMYVCFDRDAEDLADQLQGTLSTGVTLAEEKKQQEALAKKKAEAQKQNGTTASVGSTSASSYEECLLAAIVDWEAGSECMEGQLAVAYVVLNRVNAGYGGNQTIESVIAARGQFSGVRSGDGWSDAFQQRIDKYTGGGGRDSCKQAASQALAGVNNPLDATYYHFNTRVGSVSQSQQIGNHIFY